MKQSSADLELAEPVLPSNGKPSTGKTHRKAWVALAVAVVLAVTIAVGVGLGGRAGSGGANTHGGGKPGADPTKRPGFPAHQPHDYRWKASATRMAIPGVGVSVSFGAEAELRHTTTTYAEMRNLDASQAYRRMKHVTIFRRALFLRYRVTHGCMHGTVFANGGILTALAILPCVAGRSTTSAAG